MRTLNLSATAQVTLDASGNGTAFTGPGSFLEVWSDLTVSVRCSTNVKEALCSVFTGASTDPGNYACGTTWGSTGDSSTNVGTVQMGGNVFAVWTGGDAGAKATLSITGTKVVT
jgi:hypothetical protein